MKNYVSGRSAGRLAYAVAVLACTSAPVFAWAQSSPGSDISNAPSDLNQPASTGNDTVHKEPTPTLIQRQPLPGAPGTPGVASNLLEMFTQGNVALTLRTIYYTGNDVFFNTAKNQDTVSYGGQLGFTSASLYGVSFGVSGFLQRPLVRSDNPLEVDTFVGPSITTLGEAYLRYKGYGFTVTAGDQQINVPFASAYDWRMAPQLFQGVMAKYGDDDNFITVYKMFRFKSYIDDGFNKHTLYSQKIDATTSVGNRLTNGFYGIGAAHNFDLSPALVKTQGWYQMYQDYANLLYLESQITRSEGRFKPFAGVQFFNETSDGRELLGPVRAQEYGAQVGVKHDSLTFSIGYDHIVPHQNSFLNGALVTPYSHKVSAGPQFAQPFLDSTQDLGSGNAYSIDLNGSPLTGLVLGARYSFMNLRTSQTVAPVDQSEYLLYATYKFGGSLKGFSVANYFGLEYSPIKAKKFIQNRLTLQYQWNSRS